VRRPRRNNSTNVVRRSLAIESGPRPALVWGLSFAVWIFIALAATITIYKLYSSTNSRMPLSMIFGMEFSQIFTYAPLTPFIFALGIRFPIQKDNWVRRSLLHLVAGVVFCLFHIALRGATPYAYWDPKAHSWASALWNSGAHSFGIKWPAFRGLFFSNVVDDITGAYVPVVLIAQAFSYYRRFRERELRTAQLEGQLAKAHLQTLKSQLQPHFLFNTLHSISALMLTDVRAADRMMTRLSDLLRMSLETAGTQVTTLNRELEFMNCYLEIEKVRFEERLNVTLDIAPETLDALVPHLVLQPLVDNAVKHGISQLVEGGAIVITSSVEDGVLQLVVRDNGPGLGQVTMFHTTGLGLRVTRERLETMYGQDQSVEMLSPPEGGVEVRVCLPLRVQAAESQSEEIPVMALRQTG
jgi:two-component system LytT family sensor kinase